MKVKEIVKRYSLFVFSLFISSIGVAILKKCNLGISPMSSVSNVLSIKYDIFSLGEWVFIWNVFLLLLQIVILRKKFKIVSLLQIPLSFIFGMFIDFSMWVMEFVNPSNYLIKIVLLFIGIFVLSLGISLAIIADAIMNSGEALVKAISDTINKNFGTIKRITDIVCVIISVVMSLIFFDFKIVGVREGTILIALFTGTMVNFITKRLKNKISKYLI